VLVLGRSTSPQDRCSLPRPGSCTGSGSWAFPWAGPYSPRSSSPPASDDQRHDHRVVERPVVRRDPGDELHPVRNRAHRVERHEATPIPGSLPPQTSSVVPHVGFFGQVIGVWLWSEILWVVAIALVIHYVLKRPASVFGSSRRAATCWARLRLACRYAASRSGLRVVFVPVRRGRNCPTPSNTAAWTQAMPE